MIGAPVVDDAIPSVLVILDGLGDRPCTELGGRTPAEAASTPVLDELTRRGTTGVHVPFGPGWATSSERSHWAMFGLSDVPFPGRALLELAGVGGAVPWGVPMWHLALRRGEYSGSGIRITGRAGRNDADEAAQLGRLISLGPAQDTYSGISFGLLPLRTAEWVLVAHGAESVEVSDTDPLFEHVHPWMKPVPTAAALRAAGNRLDEAERTARALESFLLSTRRALLEHDASFDVPTTKWASRLDEPLSYYDLVGVAGAMTPSSALYRGLARVLAMDAIEVQASENDLAMGLAGRVNASVERLDGSIGFIHVHTKATDEAGHTKDPHYKVSVIEACDAALAPLLDQLDSTSVMVTGDHATPSTTSLLHSGDPTPLVLAGPDIRADDVSSFGEKTCARGDLGRLRASDISPMLFSTARRPFFIGHQPGAYVTAALPQGVQAMPAADDRTATSPPPTPSPRSTRT